MKVVGVFGNRNQTMQFASILKRMGIRNQTIDTPRELSVSCGISVIFNYDDLDRVRYILNKVRLSSFIGFFKVIINSHFKKYQRI
jgi:hypothetical protein